MSIISATYVDHMGNDDSVVNAARMSMDAQAKDFTAAQNKSLTTYLNMGQSSKDTLKDIQSIVSGALDDKQAEALLYAYKNRSTHWTPFAHTAVSLRVTAPVPIRTQCFKHKQGLIENEESRRYITSTPELYLPIHFRGRPANIKQGSDGIHYNSHAWLDTYESHCQMMIGLYEDMVADQVAPEQARFVLPQGCMVNWQWTGNIFAFAKFYLSRTDPHAQQEVAEVAYAIEKIIQPLFPQAWEVLTYKGL